MNANEIIELDAMVWESDPRPIDPTELAELMFRHLNNGGFLKESDKQYLVNYFNRLLRRAVYEDRSTRMVYQALKP